MWWFVDGLPDFRLSRIELLRRFRFTSEQATPLVAPEESPERWIDVPRLTCQHCLEETGKHTDAANDDWGPRHAIDRAGAHVRQ